MIRSQRWNMAILKTVNPILLSQISIGLIIGSVIACSPIRFTPTENNAAIVCDGATSCVVSNGIVNISDNFQIGAGKVDILFINDNSASMSPIQAQLALKFSGFIKNLDDRKIDYRIAITSTDLEAVKSKGLITFDNGKSFISNTDANRFSLFNSAIIRPETLNCETFITSMFNTYGSSFQSRQDYAVGYPQNCASPDTRGIYTGNLVVSQNTDSFIRTDANLNIILISNDDVRQGRYSNDAKFSLLEADSATGFTAMMSNQYPNKYWDFNSIIVKDASCEQKQILRNTQGQIIVNDYNQPSVSGGIGLEYARLSNSPAKDIDQKLIPRGQVLDICQLDYAQNFSKISVQITDESRLFNLKCEATEAPTVVLAANPSQSVPSTWDGKQRVVFQPGSEGTSVTVKYRCVQGPE